MPKDDFRGFPEKPNIDFSEATKTKKKPREPETGFEGRSEDNLDTNCEGLKASRKGK
jgi:hypothetical protein